jgi:uncharacterized OB-fold protein
VPSSDRRTTDPSPRHEQAIAMNRPTPVVTADNEGFWLAAAEHRLVIQRCAHCGALHHPPRPMCPVCRSTELEWVDARGTGTVHSYALLHHPRHPAFDYPVPAVLVELDEGVRILSNLVGIDPHAIHIGMPVQVDFEPAGDELAVPVFRPAVESP